MARRFLQQASGVAQKVFKEGYWYEKTDIEPVAINNIRNRKCPINKSLGYEDDIEEIEITPNCLLFGRTIDQRNAISTN